MANTSTVSIDDLMNLMADLDILKMRQEAQAQQLHIVRERLAQLIVKSVLGSRQTGSIDVLSFTTNMAASVPTTAVSTTTNTTNTTTNTTTAGNLDKRLSMSLDDVIAEYGTGLDALEEARVGVIYPGDSKPQNLDLARLEADMDQFARDRRGDKIHTCDAKISRGALDDLVGDDNSEVISKMLRKAHVFGTQTSV